MNPKTSQTPQIEKEKVIQLVKETIYDGGLGFRVVDEVLDAWETIAPRLRTIAEKAAKELASRIPDEHLAISDVFAKLPDDLVRFIAMGMERGARKALELVLIGVEARVDMISNGFVKMPEAFETLPEDEVKKALMEWWKDYYEGRLTFPVVMQKRGDGLRFCMTYNTARMFAVCLEDSCVSRGKGCDEGCREKCSEFATTVGYGATLARKYLQEVLNKYGIRNSTEDFVIGNVKYVCVDIEKRQPS
jgi:ribosomal protein S13